MIYLLTPTGGRPEALGLLGQHLQAQDYDGPLTWVIVDDCDPETPIPDSRFAVELVRPGWRWEPGMNTQACSLSAGLSRVPDGAKLLVIEDDDYYAPQHITATLTAMQTRDLVGERISRYYNIHTGRYRELSGAHAALCSTGMKGSALRLFRNICKTGRQPLDIRLWRAFRGAKQMTKHQNVVGIKGMPGRGGIGVGHRRGFGVPDSTGTLREWLGDAAELYEAYRGRA